MVRFISTLVLCVVYLAVTHTALIRNKRQSRWPSSSYQPDHYGRCGEPTMPIPHGGIALFHKNVWKTRCTSHSRSTVECEPMFYCDEGYTINGDFHLECLENNATYSWIGSIPTCIRDDPPSLPDDSSATIKDSFKVLSVVLGLLFSLACTALVSLSA
eukprot:XP_011670376.1 PREDICTED: uncharacterized protein LOC105441186 [Strongylocentrotus purpuratus]